MWEKGLLGKADVQWDWTLPGGRQDDFYHKETKIKQYGSRVYASHSGILSVLVRRR